MRCLTKRHLRKVNSEFCCQKKLIIWVKVVTASDFSSVCLVIPAGPVSKSMKWSALSREKIVVSSIASPKATRAFWCVSMTGMPNDCASQATVEKTIIKISTLLNSLHRSFLFLITKFFNPDLAIWTGYPKSIPVDVDMVWPNPQNDSIRRWRIVVANLQSVEALSSLFDLKEGHRSTQRFRL